MADRNFQLESGRSVSFSTTGDSIARRLVFVFLPVGAAGLFDPDPLVTDRWGVRLIEVDRPGYAASALLEPGIVPSVDGVADNIAEYVRNSEASAEKVSKADLGSVGVVGWGSGSAFALAFAARYPDLVDRVALAAAPAPKKSRLRSRTDAEVDTIALTVGATVDTMADTVAEHPWNRLSALGVTDDDPALASISGLASRLERSLAEAATQGTFGVAADLIALDDDSWADELSKITAATQIFTGSLDTYTDGRDASWFAKKIAGSEVVTVPDAGHLVIATAWEQILAHVAPKHGGLPPEVRE
ncbi:hypothetical protein AX769_13820 [Frondihabitans sp. PAMC 28766]|uniref:alpha/beta fold hydrolase n=1 Tax=Frondihabitans sp. PAMC 28766 TaxID=1795630 RepID=UPI00078BE862|nr:alpha/beta hydrolase [Frondihabitans sp. PAMC 28766]AMM21012.1 hypothetical protein AX769_13820 [Frondihabitans sp. PAMC 28766]